MEPRRRFRFLKELAQGGFGKVYLAEMVTGDNFSSVVAIKLLHGRWLSNDEIVMRSRDEARLLGRLRHRNIVRVEDLTAINGQCAIVMEYLQGVDLKNTTGWLKEHGRRFPFKAAFEAIAAIAAGLDAAFNHVPIQGGTPLQVIHRDIKPSNAMITIEGDVKVLDFGTARATFEEREAKTQVLAFGSQAYMSPERTLDQQDGSPGDIFSLGITLYELLTLESYGKIQLREERFEETREERIAGLELADLPEDAREDTRNALRRLLAYKPEGRPVAAEVVEMMESLADRSHDAGLKRFAREAVKLMLESASHEPDPNDPYMGSTLFEDVSGVSDSGPNGAAATLPPRAEPTEEEPFQPPPELAEAPQATVAMSQKVGETSGASGVRRANLARTDLGTSGPRVGGGPRSDGGTSGATRTSGASTISGATAVEPAKGGGTVKLVAALLLFGVGGLVLAAGGWWWWSRQEGTGGTSRPVIVEKRGRPGTPDVDWSANASGKGGALLRAPGGAAEVIFSSTTGFRDEWDGSQFLRLKDLEPGVVRTKLRPADGGPVVMSTFEVEADRTCAWTFTGRRWEQGECR
jgi:serine/threonine protein kinase